MNRRAFVDRPLAIGQQFELDGDAFRHIFKVLRSRQGDRLLLFNGEGGEYSAEILAVGKRSATVQVDGFAPEDRAPQLDWTLVQAVSKGDRMDYTLQKCTELGMRQVIPVLAERSVVSLDGERARKRVEHWRGVVRSACEQCGLNRVPGVVPLHGFRGMLENLDADTMLMLDPEADSAITDVDVAGRVALLVGPEGGFSDKELEQARAAGFRGVRMGSRVLRTETAAVVAAAVMLAGAGDLD